MNPKPESASARGGSSELRRDPAEATSGREGGGGPDLKITLPVEGMTCAACQATVQRALTKTPGVANAAVNLMTNEATISYDPAVTGPEGLVAAINDTGYESWLPAADHSASPPADADREAFEGRAYETLRTKALVSLALGALAMIVSMPLMGGTAGHGEHSGDPLLRWTMTRRVSIRWCSTRPARSPQARRKWLMR